MSNEVSKLRINILRAVYLFIFIVFGFSIWPSIISPNELWDPIEGVTYSFWGAFSLLSILGVRYPLKMLPLLFIQSLGVLFPAACGVIFMRERVYT